MSHKDNQSEDHTHLINAITGGQLQEPVSAESRTKLAHQDSQKKDKDEEQHSDKMLMRCDEDIMLLERLLKEPEYEEEMFQTPKQIEYFSCFQTNYEFAGTKEAEMRSDEAKMSHEKEIVFYLQQEVVEQKIVLKDNREDEETKGKQQAAKDELTVQGKTNAVNTYVAENNEYKRDRNKSFEDESQTLIQQPGRRQFNALSIFWRMYVEEEWIKSYGTLIQEKIQLQMGNICKPKNELDSEINKLWELMKKNPKRRYSKRKQTVSNGIQLTERF